MLAIPRGHGCSDRARWHGHGKPQHKEGTEQLHIKNSGLILTKGQVLKQTAASRASCKQKWDVNNSILAIPLLALIRENRSGLNPALRNSRHNLRHDNVLVQAERSRMLHAISLKRRNPSAPRAIDGSCAIAIPASSLYTTPQNQGWSMHVPQQSTSRIVAEKPHGSTGTLAPHRAAG